MAKFQADAAKQLHTAQLKMKEEAAAAMLAQKHKEDERQRKMKEDIEAKSQERAERIMFRVGMRMKNRELSDAVLEWREQQVEEKQRLRAEGIMRRVGGRMRNRELALNYAEWCRNYRGDVVTMWQNRNAQLTMELETLQMKFMMTTQVRGRVRQCGVHVRMSCVQGEFKQAW